MKGHEFVLACQVKGQFPQAVFLDFDGQPDPTLPIPVVIASRGDLDYRWARGLRIHVSGIDSEAVFEAVEALKRFNPSRIIATYLETRPVLIWDSEIDQ
jgi:hypothetical protein